MLQERLENDFIVFKNQILPINEINNPYKRPVRFRFGPVRNEIEKRLGGVSVNVLVAHLYKQGMSTVEMGKILGQNPNTITYWLRSEGVEMRHLGRPARRAS